MTTDQARQLISTDEKFVYSKRFEYNIDKLAERHPEGCSNRVIAGVLMITEDDVDDHYERIVKKLRALMGVDDSL
jgi:hypothetical protein